MAVAAVAAISAFHPDTSAPPLRFGLSMLAVGFILVASSILPAGSTYLRQRISAGPGTLSKGARSNLSEEETLTFLIEIYDGAIERNFAAIERKGVGVDLAIVLLFLGVCALVMGGGAFIFHLALGSVRERALRVAFSQEGEPVLRGDRPEEPRQALRQDEARLRPRAATAMRWTGMGVSCPARPSS